MNVCCNIRGIKTHQVMMLLENNQLQASISQYARSCFILSLGCHNTTSHEVAICTP